MQIDKVNFLEDYIIEIILTNKEKMYFDLKPLLQTARFKHIVSEEFFKKGKLISQCCIYWDDVTELQDYEIFGGAFID